MAGETESWSYRVPLGFAIRFIFTFLTGQKRDMQRDAAEVFGKLRPAPQARDTYNIPAQGPFLLLVNHYERPKLGVFWSAWFISLVASQRRQTGRHIHWVMTSEWERLGIAGISVRVPRWLFRILFVRFADMYDLIIMPADPGQAMQRAIALRRAESVLARSGKGKEGLPEGEPVGFFPEGPGAVTTLHEAMPGTGLFFLRICQKDIPLVPAGIAEREGTLTVTFGPTFKIELPTTTDRDTRDRLAREQTMVAIGKLLPPDMWGFYAQLIQQSLERVSKSDVSGEAAHPPHL